MRDVSPLKNFSGNVKKKDRKKTKEYYVVKSLSLPPELFKDIEKARGITAFSTYIQAKLRPVVPRREK